MNDNEIRDVVREKYGKAALQVKEGRSSCCGTAPSACCGTAPSASGLSGDPITSNLYADHEKELLPTTAVQASLGCGNPTALAKLEEGQVVLDLGSGGGIDVLLSAKRVGPTGKAYGLDMTDEMLEAAGRTVKASGFETIRLLKGVLERIPLADGSVDAIISNCVINLSGDKAAVLREALRVLRPGGRLCVADTTFSGSVPDAIRNAGPEAWCG